MLRRIAIIGIVTLLIAFVAVQFVPYGRAHPNPNVHSEPAWDSPQTRELAVRACFDCHSNDTRWPWYTNIAPSSWLADYDVREGREHLNFSEWNRSQEDASEAAETVQDGSMPPWYYGIMHGDARLSDSERAALIQGLQATFGTSGEDEDDE